MRDIITIDGSQGEGGGQILRTALALSLVTGRPFRIDGIRAGRPKPGLLRQHLTAVQAAERVGNATVEGATLGARSLTFTPGAVRGGDVHLAVGTAGSTTLVLQAVLPALLTAPVPSRIELEGGTHNPFAPPFEFLQRTLLPLLGRMGARVDVTLHAHGFYPAGGGRITVEVHPCERLQPLSLLQRGPVRVSARALTSAIPERVATRELSVVQRRLDVPWTSLTSQVVTTSPGPGNVLLIELESDEVTEVVAGFGEKGVSAQDVADAACTEARTYLQADVPVGIHLADQLLVPLALAGGGTFRTLTPSAHTLTNIAVISQFLELPIRQAAGEAGTSTITIGASHDAD